jgi:NAD(P)-dependent dehydrogenase (short-subunit alcohol dehydrogenase family)
MKSSLNIRPLTVEKTGMKRGTLEGEVAVVTGGGSNIGLGTARSLAWLGARVVIAQRTEQKGLEAAALINQENGEGRAIYIQTDVASEDSVNNMAKKAVAVFGKVDILLNNAMIMGIGGNSILGTRPEVLDQQYAVSARGTLHCLRAFVPAMLEKRHGVVGYLASGFRMARGGGSYFAIKGAASAMMMSLAGELGDVKDTGVAVFMLVPGNVVEPADDNRTWAAQENMFAGLNVGYQGPMSPEDSGAALAYSIVHAAEIHGSGVTTGQVQKHMGWPFPNPELVPHGDFDRLRDGVGVRIYGYMGEGFPQPGYTKYSLSRSDSAPGELKPFVTLMKEMDTRKGWLK